MIKFKRLTIALAALFIASATAWADEAKVYTEAVAFNSLKAGDVLTDGFSITKNIGDYIKVKGYKKDSGTAETEEYSDPLDACTYPGGVVITVSGYGISGNYTPYADGKDANAWIVSKKEVNGSATMLYLDGYNYLPTIALTEVIKGKQWKIESMPASNVELQVEYFAESNLFLSKDALADKDKIAVTAGETTVEFDDNGKSTKTVTESSAMTVTYNGTKKLLGMKVEKGAPTTTVTWNSSDFYFDENPYTKDGVTLTPSNGQAANGNNLNFYGDNTFTTTLGKFIKIEIVFESTSYTFDGWTKETVGQFQPLPDLEPDFWADLYKLTWTGDAESVTIKGKDVFGIHSITFTIQ